jgi:hypothetical protein
MKLEAFLFHPGDLVGAECIGTLQIPAFPFVALFIVIYVFAKRGDKS